MPLSKMYCVLALGFLTSQANSVPIPRTLPPQPQSRDISSVLSPPRESARLAVALKAQAFPLQDVRLLDGVFKRVQEVDRAYLLSLDPDRLLSGMLRTSKIQPKSAPYGGWDKAGSGSVGHYLSACAQMAASTGDTELRRRVDYIVSEMARCQKANGNGGLFAFENDKYNWFPALERGEVKAMTVAGWYAEHKIMAGLRDAWLISGNLQARQVLIGMCDWCVQVTAKLTPAAWEFTFHMGISEFGAPHEILADVYAATGQRKYLETAEKFKQPDIFEASLRGDSSPLSGVHANAAIAKYLGYERIYEVTGEKTWHRASLNFFDDVVAHRSWANGGNSQWEHFFEPHQNSSKVDEICGPETCNTYNMLKMAGQLYSLDPKPRYLDFYERALYNSILPSQSPQGGFVYYTSMRPGHYRVFSLPTESFWCCVGTGMENHAKYGELIYAHAPDRLMVNLFAASALQWREKGLSLHQETSFPAQPRTSLSLTLAKPQNFTLSIRYPSWVSFGSLKVKVNGQPQLTNAKPNSYLNLKRRWKTGDKISIELPLKVNAEMLTEDPSHVAFFYGPILLAGKMGSQGMTLGNFFGGGGESVLNPVPGSSADQIAKQKRPITDFPVLIARDHQLETPQSLAARLMPLAKKPLNFQLNGTSSAVPVILAPLYDVAFERTSIYWPVMSATALAQKRQTESAQFAWETLQVAEEKRQDLETVTLDRVLIGDSASEIAHNFVSQQSNSGGAGDSHWRDAAGFFAYEMKVSPTAPNAMRVRYYGGDDKREFDVLVNGKVVATQKLMARRTGAPLFSIYPIPAEMTHDLHKVTVRFQPKTNSTAGGVFDLRTIIATPETQLLQ